MRMFVLSAYIVYSRYRNTQAVWQIVYVYQEKWAANESSLVPEGHHI